MTTRVHSKPNKMHTPITSKLLQLQAAIPAEIKDFEGYLMSS